MSFAIRGVIFLALLCQTWPALRMALSHREAEAVLVSKQCGKPNLAYFDFVVDEVSYHGKAEYNADCAELPLQGRLDIYYVPDDPSQNMLASSDEPLDVLGMQIVFDLILLALLFPSVWRGFIKRLQYD